jgi:ribonuclease Z
MMIMTLSHLSRLLVGLVAVAFAGIGCGFWAAPDQTGALFGIDATSPAALVTLRADFGGLFIGLALLCAAALWTRQRPWFLGAAMLLAAIALGRLIGWTVNGGPGDNLPALIAELGAIAVLIAGARSVAIPAQVRSHDGSRRWLAAAGAVTLVVIAAGATVLFSSSAQQRIFAAAAERATANVNSAPLADDALRVAICGSSAPLPSAARAKPCVAVFAGGRFYIVDAGPESTENLVLWGIPLSSVGAVLLTHFHSDHIGDLGELNLQTWAGGRPSPLAVYGGPGVERVVAGFNEAYRSDQGYRTAHHTDRVMPSATWPMIAHPIELDGAPTPAKDRTALVLDQDGLRITAIEVDHAPIAPAYAYRFDYKDRSVVVTGDLKYHPPLAAASKNADLLVSEAIAVSMTRALGESARRAGRDRTAVIMHDIEDYHITPAQAAQIANDAKVQLLAFYHLLPSPDGMLPRRLFAQGVNDVRPTGWTIADDGVMYTLPIGTKEIRTGRID